MKSRSLFAAALIAATPALFAQDEKAAAIEMPDPKQAEHAVLASLAGTWSVEMKSEAMPGVPDMEEPTESKGTEHAELICNGLWLKVVLNATYKDEPFQGVWLAGYDPFQKKYTGIWVSSDDQECGACTFDGTYDAKAGAWTWSGMTPHGEMRSVFVVKDKDHTIETCYMKTPDGKEMKCMEITRTRSKAAGVVNASATQAEDLPPEHALLQKDIGVWDATVKMSAAGQPPSESKATERVAPICNNRWLWTDFSGQLMGAPFEGHGLVGYDPNLKQYVSFWVDSMSAAAVRTSGTYDAAKKAFTMQGKSTDPAGTPMTVKELLTWKDDNTRVLQMEFKGGEETSNMEITYKRKAN